MYYDKIVEKNSGSLKHVSIIIEALEAYEESKFQLTLEEIAGKHNISTRTLQRYFEATTSITGKHAFQMIRIRKAVEKLSTSPGNFHYSNFGYYDYSHFFKHLKQFITSPNIEMTQPHLRLINDKVD
jgi:transcriptional regulator GlxA family with amidase domain